MRLTPAILVPVVLSALMLSGCSNSMGGGSSSSSSSAATSAAATRSVGLYDNYFEDGNLTVAPDTTITYTNEGTHGHTVTIHWVGDPLTTIKLNQTLQPGEKVSYTFATSGTYHVWCRFHGQMTSGMATIVKVQ